MKKGEVRSFSKFCQASSICFLDNQDLDPWKGECLFNWASDGYVEKNPSAQVSDFGLRCFIDEPCYFKLL